MRNVGTLKFKGARNPGPVDHNLFFSLTPKKQQKSAKDKKVSQVCLIYGRNGAGKSSFARDLATSLTTGACTATTLSGDEVQIGDLNSGKVKPVLFNEDFVNTIGFREEGGADGHLKTIVLFGEQKDNQEKIDRLKAEIGEQRRLQTEKDNRLTELQREKTGDLAKASDELKKALQADGAWADSLKQATGQQRVQVNKTVVAQIKNFVAAAPFDLELETLFEQRRTALDDLKTGEGAAKVGIEVDEYKLPCSLGDLESLLLAKPEVDVDGEKEQHFRAILGEPGGTHLVQLMQKTFTDESTSVCPGCTQEVAPSLRKELSDALQSVLGAHERVQLVDRIENIGDLAQNYPAALERQQEDVVGEKEATEFAASRTALISEIKYLESLRQEKRRNPDSEVQLDAEKFRAALKRFDEVREKCSRVLSEFNRKVEERDETLKSFRELNYKIAAIDPKISAAVKRLTDLETEEEGLGEDLESLKQKIASLRKDLATLESQKSDHAVAVDLINNYLSIVFADADRMVLEAAERGYRILSRGVDVKLDDLSTGERNIIALCYFIANIFRESSDYRSYKEARFIILDDPVSSFDSENKFGVFLLLRQVFERFLANADTKIVLLSHDLGLVQDIFAVFKTLNVVAPATRQIASQELRYLNLDQAGSYTEHLKKIYDYALLEKPEEADQNEIPTGNEMRVVLEAFAEFEISSNIVDLPKTSVVGDFLKNESIALDRYFKGSIYKLLLHGESHSAEAVRAGRFELGPVATGEERQTIARELIALISVVSPAHIPAKLSMTMSGNDQNNPYHFKGFVEHCQQWKSVIEDRTLAASDA